MRENLFGQPLVQKTLVNALKGHYELANPPKALVLSLHGGTGTGKNHAAYIVAKNLYKNGLESDFVRLFSATNHFPHPSKVLEYKVSNNNNK